MENFYIQPLDRQLEGALWHKINQKTKPIGALGKLEKLALQLGCIQNTLSPKLEKPTMVVFAGDHGIAKEGVSPYPQEVTYQMVYNFLQGGAAINVFARLYGMELKVVDAGVNHHFSSTSDLINAKVGMGTRSFLHQSAMTREEFERAVRYGADIVNSLYMDGCNVVGFGEMGIGNTSAASMIMSLLALLPLENCVGRGTGLDEEGLKKKTAILKQALAYHKEMDTSVENVLQTFAGFEMVMMFGAILKAAELQMTILMDGFIATSVSLAAVKLYPQVLDYMVFAHQSDEKGHKLMLEQMGAEPLLQLGLRLGEGTGAAIAYPVICSAVAFLNEMSSFDSAGVSNKDK
jgi:nicotinate-nucleotide--dimethylbenzimidazole phosphoribosyltransferase